MLAKSTVKKMLDLLEDYEEREGIYIASIELFSDGSGRVYNKDLEPTLRLITFDNLNELEKFLTKN